MYRYKGGTITKELLAPLDDRITVKIAPMCD